MSPGTGPDATGVRKPVAARGRRRIRATVSVSESHAARQARTIRYGDEQARDAVLRAPAGAPRQRSAT